MTWIAPPSLPSRPPTRDYSNGTVLGGFRGNSPFHELASRPSAETAVLPWVRDLVVLSVDFFKTEGVPS